MPLHDWTRVDAGIFHHFHLLWIAELSRALNGGLLPDGFYALGEQVTSGGNPDVLALHEPGTNGTASGAGYPGAGGTALLTAPPGTRLTARAEQSIYTARQRQIAIRHTSGDRVVALIELVSAGNKASEYPWQSFLDKMLGALHRGIHLLILGVYPPTPRDPDGVHGAIWGQLTGEEYHPPADADRTLAAYAAGSVEMAHVEPVAVGATLRDMPLFLTPDGYVFVPLEATYQLAYEGVPQRYRRLLEAAG